MWFFFSHSFFHLSDSIINSAVQTFKGEINDHNRMWNVIRMPNVIISQCFCTAIYVDKCKYFRRNTGSLSSHPVQTPFLFLNFSEC